MIRSLNQNDIKTAAEYLFRRSLSSQSASYPRFTKYQDAEREISMRIFDKLPIALGIFDGNDVLSGLLLAFADGKYLQTTAFTAEGMNGYDELILYLLQNYSDYDINIGLAMDNSCGCDALERFGFTVIEASFDMRLDRSAYYRCPFNIKIQRISDADFSEYAKFHDAHFKGIYWNSKRIKDRLKDWRVYLAYADGKPCAGLFMTLYGENAEIYGIGADAEYNDTLLPLLSHSMDAAFKEEQSVQSVLFMIDEDDTHVKAKLKAAIDTGFSEFGRYRLYQRS